MNDWIEKELLIIAKTHPIPSVKHVETVCTGAISREGEWLRLYPVSFRYLSEDQKYPLWSWISVRIKKHIKDDRKETYSPDEDSILVIGKPIKDEKQKIQLLLPFTSRSLEDLQSKYKEDKTSIGMIKIRPIKFYWDITSHQWEPRELAIISQLDLFVQKKPLDKIPYRFKLKYECKDNATCRGHDQGILIWDWYEGYRQFLKNYGTEENALDKIRETANRNYFNDNRECYAIVGNLASPKLRKTWIIGGLFAPQKMNLQQQILF